MLTLSLYKQYQEYRKCLRDSATELSTFLEQFEKHILKLEEIIYEHCTIPELKILNFLLSCNLSDEDIEKVLVWSEGCTEICLENANGNDSKKIFQTLSRYLTGRYEIVNKEEEVKAVVIKILKTREINSREGDYFTDFGNDFCPQTSEDEDGINLPQEDKKSLHEKFDNMGLGMNETNNPGERKVEKRKPKIIRVKCDLCEKMVPRGRLKVHIRRVHTDTRVPCPLCGKMVSKQHVSGHVRRHKTETSEVFTCQECDFSTHIKEYLTGHISRNHRQKKFGCEICGKLFESWGNLNRHKLNSHGDKVNCPSCSFQTSNADVMQTHINNHHSSAVVFSCVFCNFETGDSKELQSHLGSFHPDKDTSASNVRGNARKRSKPNKEATERPSTVYKCEYQGCDYTVRNKGSLRRHVEKEHLKILYNCEFCDHVTNLKSSLKTHKLRKHPTQFKMYSCHLCNFKTQSKDLLQKHVTGLKHNF